MWKIYADLSLNNLLKNEFYKLADSLLKNNDQFSKAQIIGDHLSYLRKHYDLNIIVEPLNPVENIDEPRYKGDFESYFHFHKVKMRKSTINLSCVELGHYFTIIKNSAYNTGRIEFMKSKSPMLRKDLVELLQITDEPCKKLINKLIAESLLKLADGKLKNVVSCPRNLVQRNGSNYQPEKIKTVPNFRSQWLFSTYALERKIFMKTNKSERKSKGKETLGVFLKLIFLMNEQNEVKSRTRQSIQNYVLKNTDVTNIQFHLDILINENLIQIEDNIIYVNPTAVMKSNRTMPEKNVNLFKIMSDGRTFDKATEN
jgi:hypothetical protein